MQLHKLACRFMSLHAVPWNYMKYHELACSSLLCLSSSQEFRSACLFNIIDHLLGTIFMSEFLLLSLLSWIPRARVYSAICSSMVRVSTPSPASDFDSWAWHSELFLSAPQEIAQNILVENQDRKRFRNVKNILNDSRHRAFLSPVTNPSWQLRKTV